MDEIEALLSPVHEPLLLYLHSSHLMMSERSLESNDSDVSLKSDRSKDGLIDFKDRVSPGWVDFDSDVSTLENLTKLLDDRIAEEMAQREMEMVAEIKAALAQHHMKIMVIKTPQRDKEWRAERRARLRKKMMAEREAAAAAAAQRHMKMMAEREVQREREKMAEREVQREREKRAEREARLRKKRISMSGLFDEPFQLYPDNSPPRVCDFDSDVSNDEDFFESSDDQRAEREAQREKERRAGRETLPGPFHEPLLLHPHWSHPSMALRRPTSEPAKSDFHIPLRPQSPLMMSERSLESNDSDVSLKSDRSKDGLMDFKDRVSPRRAEREAQCKKEKRAERETLPGPFHEPLLLHPHWSHPRSDFSFSQKKHDVTYVEEWIGSLDDHRSDDLIGPDIDPVGDHYDQMSERSLESSDSDVSLKSDQSKAELMDFKDRVSPRLADFSSSKEEHVVSDDEDFFESSDDLRATGWLESIYSVVSFLFNRFCSLLVWVDSFLLEKKHNVTYVEDWIKSSDDQMVTRSLESIHPDVSFQSAWSKDEPIDFKHRASRSMATGRPESIHSGVSLQSDWSKAEPISFKDRVSPSGIITVTVTLAVAGLFISARCVRS